ncbi:MAG: hypothetical protein CL609_23460 [Anaerolineaceae bacterium]|nr:hypothetical protein [Anaerolineaceae bacterium]
MNQIINQFIEPAQQGSYFTIPFNIPQGVEVLHVRYAYNRFNEQDTRIENRIIGSKEEVNIIDLGLLDPQGNQVGTSGSDKESFFVSEPLATPGYKPSPLIPGEWQILVGAYKVAPEGVTVTYEITFTLKKPNLLKGDLHTHTIASDGVHTAEELAWKAKRAGLDFVAVTDHNQMVSADALPRLEGVTLIAGVEWTHYKGHANFLGVDKPFDGCFATNTAEETQAIFQTARERGALISINHPFEECCQFQFDMNTLPFDCLEVWNGPMRESNLKAIGLWQSMLAAGKKMPICAGSDYHKDTPFIFLGGPTTCVYALSNGTSDILQALRQGHAYLTFAPDAPSLKMSADNNTIMGDSIDWSKDSEMKIEVDKLLAGDVIRLITAQESQPVWKAEKNGRFEMTIPVEQPGFIRLEILRAFLPGLPLLPALISNPIYFDAK